MKITEEILEQGKSKYGSWGGKQLAQFGIKYPLVVGWKDRLIGQDFPEENVKRFLELKDQHLTAKLEKRKQKKNAKRAKYREERKRNESYAVADFFRVTEGL